MTLGSLEHLPLELIQHIMLEMDMASLFQFRQASFRARQCVDSVRQYRVVKSHALNAFCALLQTKLAAWVTLSDFYQLLCNDHCGICSSFGNLVHLPTWTRCCSSCLTDHSPKLRMIAFAALRSTLELNMHFQAKLPKFRNLPGIYSMDQRSYTRRTWLVPYENAVAIYRQQNSGAEPTDEMLVRLRPKLLWDFMSCCAISSYNPRTDEADAGISCAGCQLAVEVDDVAGYFDQMRIIAHRDEIHSTASFLKHFAWCEHAPTLWISSNGGTTLPLILPQLCRSGGFLNTRD